MITCIVIDKDGKEISRNDYEREFPHSGYEKMDEDLYVRKTDDPRAIVEKPKITTVDSYWENGEPIDKKASEPKAASIRQRYPANVVVVIPDKKHTVEYICKVCRNAIRVTDNSPKIILRDGQLIGNLNSCELNGVYEFKRIIIDTAEKTISIWKHKSNMLEIPDIIGVDCVI